MSRSEFTIMLLSDSEAKPKVFNISRLFIFSTLVVSVSFFLAFGFLVVDFVHNYQKSAHNTSLEHENASMKNEIGTLMTRLEGIQLGLDKVNQFYRKLLLWSNIQGTTASSAGIGPITDEEYALSRQSRVGTEGDVLPPAINSNNLLFKSVFDKIDKLDRVGALQLVNMQSLMKSLVEQQDMLASRPSINPTKGWTTSNFGTRISPFTGRKTFHSGVDIAASNGTPIIAPANATVVFAGRKGSYGNVISLDHGNGVVTMYAHVSDMYVRVGQHLKRGDRIASVGNTGRSTGPHLHYEVKVNGIYVDPRQYILND